MPRKTTKQRLDECWAEFFRFKQAVKANTAASKKLVGSYLDRLTEVEADLREGRITLAHAKVTQLMEACRSLPEGGGQVRDPWE
jgi:hypothetical protein